jgi:hypothetical protein
MKPLEYGITLLGFSVTSYMPPPSRKIVIAAKMIATM